MQGQGICTSLLGPRQKKKYPLLTARAILVIHVMPGGLVGQGAEFSRSSCVLVKLTVRQPKRVSISLLFSLQTLLPLPSPPSACLAQCPDLLKLTLNQKYPLPPPLNISLWLNREASITPDDIGSFFPPCTFQPKRRTREGSGCRFCSVIISLQSSRHVYSISSTTCH